jgi:hypothetical protein
MTMSPQVQNQGWMVLGEVTLESPCLMTSQHTPCLTVLPVSHVLAHCQACKRGELQPDHSPIC